MRRGIFVLAVLVAVVAGTVPGGAAPGRNAGARGALDLLVTLDRPADDSLRAALARLGPWSHAFAHVPVAAVRLPADFTHPDIRSAPEQWAFSAPEEKGGPVIHSVEVPRGIGRLKAISLPISLGLADAQRQLRVLDAHGAPVGQAGYTASTGEAIVLDLDLHHLDETPGGEPRRYDELAFDPWTLRLEGSEALEAAALAATFQDGPPPSSPTASGPSEAGPLEPIPMPLPTPDLLPFIGPVFPPLGAAAAGGQRRL